MASRMGRWPLLVGLVLALLPAAAGAQESSAPERWTGCWNVEWGEWRPPLPEHVTLAYLPAPRIELTSDSASMPLGGAYEQRPASGSLPTPHSATTWQPMAEDSLRLYWSDGHIGTVGRFAGQGDTLRGELATFTDVVPHQKQRADAKLVRVSCSAPPEVPASAQRPVVRSVPLAGGDTISLGEPLPEGRIERFNVTAYLIEGTPTGLFDGARDVRVRVTRNGRAADIRVSYEPEASLDSLVALFSDSLGSPTGRTSRGGETNLRWESRTTSFRLRRAGAELLAYLADPRLNWTVPADRRREGPADTARDVPR